jgi:hypothetical protein
VNEGETFYHLLHFDGDDEDLDIDETTKAVRAYDLNLQKAELELESGDGTNEDQDEDVDAQGEETDELVTEEDERDSYNSDSDIDSVEDVRKSIGGDKLATDTLWPTAEIRARWRAAVTNAHTVGELALALGDLCSAAKSFGMMPPEENDVGFRVSSSSSKSKSSSSSSKSGSKSGKSGGGSKSKSSKGGSGKSSSSSSKNSATHDGPNVVGGKRRGKQPDRLAMNPAAGKRRRVEDTRKSSRSSAKEINYADSP